MTRKTVIHAAVAVCAMVALSAPAVAETGAEDRHITELARTSHICVAYELKQPVEMMQGDSQILVAVSSLIETYEDLGVDADNLEIHVVVHGDAAGMLLRDEAYAALDRSSETNPHRQDLALLLHSEVSIEMCGNTIERMGWSEDDILPAVEIVPGAIVRLVDLQHRGCAYISF